MFRAVATRSVRAVQVCSKPSFAQTRAFSGILSENEQQAGRRKEEVDAEASGKVAFNRDPIIPDENAGTKENPILVIFFFLFFSKLVCLMLNVLLSLVSSGSLRLPDPPCRI